MLDKVRPEPIATVRYLYGVTAECAFPGCGEPLFKAVEGTSRRQLNSTVAHIWARRSRGPRWDLGMREVDNRAPENLVLLCLLHSSAVDSEPEDFTVEMLQNWKETAENGMGVHPSPSEDEVEKILTMTICQEINLTAEIIKLGGENGGGGGAIGFGGQPGGTTAVSSEDQVLLAVGGGGRGSTGHVDPVAGFR